MKSLNVKKIAALAAGTALVGAAFATAGAITYSNTPIISESGVPQVKVVVGQTAAASDGVVAANIAAMIGNLAWRTQAVTATVSGKSGVGCTVSGATGGAGTCAISNEKVWLNVTLPGVVSGAVQFNTLINDWVDRKLENRNQSSSDDKYDQTNDPSPLEFSNAVKKFTASDFPALQTGSITDTYANVGYTEEQTLWVRAVTKYDDALKKIIGFEPDMAYKIKFTHDQYGVPVATCNPNDGAIFPGYGNPRQTEETNRTCSDTDRTDRHRVLIKFLGEDYIISDMSPPSTCVADSSDTEASGDCDGTLTGGIREGGSIRLAKESAYGIVHVGENLSTGSYYVKLADITVPAGELFQTYASIQIYDMNNNLLKEDKIADGATYTWTAPDGSKIRIRVYKNNPGYYAYAKWAEMAIYSKEFELRDGEKISDECEDWMVSLYWKNKDPSKDSKYVDSLREIIVKDEGNNANVKMVEGDTQNIICSPVVWQLQYNGLSCADPGDYDSLGMSILQRTFTLNNYGGDSSCTYKTRLPDANVLRVTSGLNQPFTVSAQGLTGQVSSFYVNLGSNLLNASYGTKLYPLNLINSTHTLNIVGDFSSQTTFTIVGEASDQALVYTQPSTSGIGADDVELTVSGSKNMTKVLAITATGGTFGNAFHLEVNSTQVGEDMRVGLYNDAGEIIWTQPGETACDFRGAPDGGAEDAVTYDAGDGTRQSFGFGPGAFVTSGEPQWCEVGVPTGVGTCQLTIEPGATIPAERYIAFREDAGNSPADYDYVRFVIQQQNQSSTTYQFVDPISGNALDTSPDKMNYTGVGKGPAPYDGPQTVGFITDRGSKFTSISSSNAAMKVAKKVCEAQYYMKTSGTAPNAPVQIGPLGEGESTVGLAGGISIKVTQITEDVGTCTAGAGSATCQVTGLDALTATPSVTDTVIPTNLDTATNKLVVLDTNADQTATLIVVGGNTVNTVASEIIRSSAIDLTSTPVVVRAIGTNRILVAGYTPQDTVTAGDQFIQALIAARAQ
ncbi:MAG: S-layer protein [Candidatus ainarchaeum sp.]|nr:S-layer protein [Candidatus ainarchaeum sp.]